MTREDLEETIVSRQEAEQTALAAEGKSELSVRAHLSAGTIVAGKYELLCVIGQGGMGVVYKARHALLNKIVAVKMLRQHLIGVSSNHTRFRQEAEAASRLNHANVVAVHDFGVTADGKPFIVMDYVEGRVLLDVLQEGRLPLARIVHIFQQACDALDHAHRKGIVHRDLKPGNIMLVQEDSDPDFVKIVDFGIAKLLLENEGKAVTQTGETVGSPQYMSPEQCLGQKLDCRSDIYAMGCLLYQALAGKPAFDGESVFEVMYKQLHEMPSGFGALRPDIGNAGQLEALVLKALSKKPGERYQSMSALKEALLSSSAGRRSALPKLLDNLKVIRLKLLPHKQTILYKLLVAATILLLLLISLWSCFQIFAPAEIPLASLDQPLWPAFKPDVKPEPEGYDEKKILGAIVLRRVEGSFGSGSPEYIQGLEASKRVYVQHGKWAEAEPVVRRLIAVRLQEGVGDDYRDTVLMPLYYSLGDCYYYQSDYAKACNAYTECLSIVRGFHLDASRRELALPLVRLADTYYFRGHFAEAGKLYLEALPGWAHHESQESRVESAAFYSKCGDTCLRLGRLDEARLSFEKAENIWSDLPGAEDQRNGGMSLYCLALIHLRLGKPTGSALGDASAAENYSKGLRYLNLAVKSLEKSAPYSRDLALALKRQAQCLADSGHLFESVLDNYRANAILSRR